MSDLWEQAQTAIQAGETRRAHVHLARLLKEEPGNSEAWYLLSQIVPSAEQKKVFLNKVLRIDPDHAGAQGDLEAMEDGQRAEVSVSTDSDDLAAQANGDTVPPWMADTTLTSPLAEGEEEEEDQGEIEELTLDPDVMPAEDIPDWLQEDSADWREEDEDEEEEQEVESKMEFEVAATPAVKPAPASLAAMTTTRPQLSPLLIVLIFAAVVVFILLVVYLINYVNLL